MRHATHSWLCFLARIGFAFDYFSQVVRAAHRRLARELATARGSGIAELAAAQAVADAAKSEMVQRAWIALQKGDALAREAAAAAIKRRPSHHHYLARRQAARATAAGDTVVFLHVARPAAVEAKAASGGAAAGAAAAAATAATIAPQRVRVVSRSECASAMSPMAAAVSNAVCRSQRAAGACCGGASVVVVLAW